ncbi:MAG: hypothetical protein P8Z38_02205 [Robiginitalea sp.]
MATVRLNIAYKSILVGACLFATLWNAQCEGEDYVASGKDTQVIEACPQDTAALLTNRS